MQGEANARGVFYRWRGEGEGAAEAEDARSVVRHH
jgi:hypothetical protein